MTLKIPNRLELKLARAVLLAIALSSVTQAQTTAFTYQGKLADNGNPAIGQYDFQFKLFDTATVGTGTQLGAVTVPTVQVTAGIFTVQLDFGVSVFPGAARFLEIAVKKTSDSTFITLGPRQAVAANPYSIHTLNADGLSVACSNCVTSSQIQSVQGSQVTGNIAGSQISGTIPVASVPPGSDNYVQNTNTPQASVNFNIGGTGTANILDATTQFNLGGNRILSNAGTNNLFAGGDAGASNTSGFQNAFFGRSAGFNNTSGDSNAFFGSSAGNRNTTGNLNSFFGSGAGYFNTTGTHNSFFGTIAGNNNTLGSLNSFFGESAGVSNTEGNQNSFFGRGAGFFNTTGSSNVFLGRNAGLGNTTGSSITIIGTNANVGANNLDHATVIGADAVVSTSNTVVLGRGADTVQIPGALNVTATFGASIINAATQYNIGGSRILGNAGNSNLFAGIGAGAVNTGSNNSFFGRNAGTNNSTGSFNAFFGESAGTTNTQGNANSFFGFNAGIINTGTSNSFFGYRAGVNNTGGFSNAFFGWEAGRNNSMGTGNSFFGIAAGEFNTTGSSNSFIGSSSGFITGPGGGDKNTTLGADATVNSGLSNATAIGAGAYAIQNNTLVLGSINGSGRGTADTNVGIGTTQPLARLHIRVGSGNILMGSTGCGAGLARIDFAFSASCTSYAMLGGDGNTHINRPSGGGIFFREGNFTQMTIKSGGVVAIEALGAAGAPQSTLCRNAAHEIAVCSSSLRYKTNLAPYRNGLDVINRLKPITFTWKEGGMRDIGLGAEDVEKVEPLLTFRNHKGEIEGVKYSQLSAVFVNAFKQQQSQIKHHHHQIADQQQQIKQQQSHLEKQQRQIEALKKLVCADHPNADVCK